MFPIYGTNKTVKQTNKGMKCEMNYKLFTFCVGLISKIAKTENGNHLYFLMSLLGKHGDEIQDKTQLVGMGTKHCCSMRVKLDAGPYNR